MRPFIISWTPPNEYSNTVHHRTVLRGLVNSFTSFLNNEGESRLSPLDTLQYSRKSSGRIGLYYLLQSAERTGCTSVVVHEEQSRIYREYPNGSEFEYLRPPPGVIRELIDAATAASTTGDKFNRNAQIFAVDFSCVSVWHVITREFGVELVLDCLHGSAFWDIDDFVMHAIIDVYAQHSIFGKSIKRSFLEFMQILFIEVSKQQRSFSIGSVGQMNWYPLDNEHDLAETILNLVQRGWIRPAYRPVMLLLRNHLRGVH